MVLVARLIELSKHIELVVDVLRGVPLLVHKQRILIHNLVIVLFLPDLHLDVGGHKISPILLSAVALGRRRMRVEGLLPVIVVRCAGSFALVIVIVVLLLLEALFHEGILALDV